MTTQPTLFDAIPSPRGDTFVPEFDAERLKGQAGRVYAVSSQLMKNHSIDYDTLVIGNTKYKPVPEYPGYLAGDDGSVWSCFKRGGNVSLMTSKWRRLTETFYSSTTESKLPRIRMGLYKDGKMKLVFLHHIILNSFVGPCPFGMECRHIDDNKANNALQNLAWGTRAENIEDKFRNGKQPFGETNGNSYLTENQVMVILAHLDAGCKKLSISKKMGIGRFAVRAISEVQTWKHISRNPMDWPVDIQELAKSLRVR